MLISILLSKSALILIKPFMRLKYKKFLEGTKSPQSSQDIILTKLLKFYSDTKYANDFGLFESMSYQEFSKKMPITKYNNLYSYIQADKSCFGKNILGEKPVVWEKTSGSSGIAKNIPYTKKQLNTIKDTILIWIFDVISKNLSFKSGKVFFSLSPPFGETGEHTSSFENDSEYLPKIINFFFKDFFVIPPRIKKIKDPYLFKVYLGIYLLSERKLECFFIWSPTYLISLLEFIQENKNEIVSFWKLGGIEYNAHLFKLPAFDESFFNENWGNWRCIWPDLKFISCWKDGPAFSFAEKLESIFPESKLQGKGLISTEAIVTIPLFKTPDPIPLYDQVFFEFMSDSGEVFLLDQLKLGQTYEVIITNFCGLIRYNLGDEVKVESFFNKTPCLRFLGRSGHFSDLTGEKLGAIALQSILKSLLSKGDTAFVAPIVNPKPHYICFYDGHDEEFREKLELKLNDIFHYNQSRSLGQLGPIEIYHVKSGLKIYNDFFVSRGIMYGDIKFNCLIKDPKITIEILEFIKS